MGVKRIFQKTSNFLSLQENILLVVLIILIIFLSIATKTFFEFGNLINILRQVSIVGIMSVGATLILISGGIDFSLGQIATLTGIFIAGLYKANFNLSLIILFSILLGISIGFINGTLVSVLGMPPFIVTLAVMIIIDGAILAYTLGYPIYIDFPSSFTFFGQGYIKVIPVPVIIMIIVFVIGYIFLNHLKIGRYFFAFGGNREAAHLSGVNTKLIGISSYVFGAVLATIAGIVLTAKLAAGLPNSGGLTLTLDAYTATILGGTSLAGGKGTIYGAIIGVLLIGVINNGLILYGIPYYFQNIVKGLIILMAVAWNSIRTMRSKL